MKKVKFLSKRCSAYVAKIVFMCFSFLLPQTNSFSLPNKAIEGKEFYIAEKSNNGDIPRNHLPESETVPSTLKYSKDHLWVDIKGDEAIVGITDYAQKTLDTFVHIEISEEDTTIDRNQAFGKIEAQKVVSTLNMPFAGKILEVNELVVDNPETINNDPYGKGWIIRIKIARPEEISLLMDSEQYRDIIK